MEPSSSRKKFDRGVSQIRQLLGEVADFEAADAYVFSFDTDQKTDREIECRVIANCRQEPPSDWPLLAGEAIQNLRASLDHFVFAATSENDSAQFPICTTRAAFDKTVKTRLKGASPEAYASIERGQPYVCTPQKPEMDPLETMRQWSNADKHRELATVAATVRLEAVGLPEHAKTSWIQFGTGRELHSGGTHVSTFHVMSEIPIGPNDLESLFRYRIEIEGRQIWILESIARQVFRVLADCELGEPLSPFAQYPI